MIYNVKGVLERQMIRGREPPPPPTDAVYAVIPTHFEIHIHTQSSRNCAAEWSVV